MARLKKYGDTLPQKLSTYQTYINDLVPNSEYFRISEFKDTLTGGKNGFYIEGSEFLKPSTDLKIQVLDVNGDPLYFEPYDGTPEYYYGIAKPVAVYVYEDTPYGMGSITIMGELSSDKLNIPKEWQDVYNVKWQRDFKVVPSLPNEDRVLFYNTPAVAITELAKTLYTTTSVTTSITGSVVGIPLVPIGETSVVGFTLPQSYRLDITDSTTWNKNVVGTNLQLPSLGYSPKVLEIVTEKTAIVSTPYTSNNLVKPFTTQGYTASYTSVVQSSASEFTGSFAKFVLTNLETAVGDVYRMKVYRKSASQLGDYNFVEDIQLESNELLTDLDSNTSTKEYYGLFTEPVITDYWVSSSNSTAVLNQSYLYNSAQLHVASDTGSFHSSASFNDLATGVEYTLKFNVRCATTSSGALTAYLSGSNTISGVPTTQTIITLPAGTAYYQKTLIEQNIQVGNIDNASLYFDVNAGTDWYISDVSLKASQETSFSPDSITFIESVPRTLPVETFDFRFQFFDINNNATPVTLDKSATFSEGNIRLVGQNVITSDLNNEFDLIATDAYGNSGSYVNTATTMSIYDGYTDVSNHWTFTTPTLSSGLTAIISTDKRSTKVTGLTVDTGAITFVATRTSYPTQTGIYKISKIKEGVSGSIGTAGYDARSVSLKVTPSTAVTFNSAGTLLSPTTIAVTASAYNTSSAANYTFYYDNKVVQSRGTSNLLTYSLVGQTFTTLTGSLEVELTEGTDTNTVYARDEVALVALKPGQNSIVVALSNTNHTFGADSTGSVYTYADSGTTVKVYEGTNALTYVTGAPAASQWTVVASPTNITTGAITGNSTDTATVANHSVLTAASAFIVYTITANSAEGLSLSATASQYFNRSDDGANAYNYSLLLSAMDVISSSLGYSPTTLAMSSSYIDGASAAPVVYAGRFKVYTGSLDSYTTVYTSAGDESNYKYTLPASLPIGKRIKVELYAAGGVTQLLDVETVPILGDGSVGGMGQNARSIILTPTKYAIHYDTGSQESDTITLSTQAYNTTGSLTYGFYLNGSATATGSIGTATSIVLADSDEPAIGATTTVQVKLFENSILVATDSVTIYAVQDGSDTINGYLTNASHVVSALADGTVADFNNAGGTYKVYVGADDVTTSCTFTTPSVTTGLTTSIISGTGVYSITALTVDSGSATYQAVIPAAIAKAAAPVTITAVYSIAKSKRGIDAVLVAVTPADQSITANSLGNGSSTPIPLVVTAFEGGTAKAFTLGTPTYTNGLAGTVSGGTITFTKTASDITQNSASMSIPVNYTDTAGLAGTQTVKASVTKTKSATPVVTVQATPQSQNVYYDLSTYTAPATVTVTVNEGGSNYTYAVAGASTFQITEVTNGTNTNAAITPTTPTSTAGIIGSATISYINSEGTTITGKVIGFNVGVTAKGAVGGSGSAGIDGRSVALRVSPTAVISYNDAGTIVTPTSLDLTAYGYNTVGAAEYQFFYDNKIIQSRSATDTLTWSGVPTRFEVMTGSLEVELYENGDATIWARAEMALGAIRSGQSTLNVVLTNDNYTFQADETGMVTSYAGSGTYLIVYEGHHALTYTTGEPANGEYRVVIVADKITCGTVSPIAVTTLKIGDHNTLTEKSASITYTVYAKSSNSGTQFTGSKVQSFTRTDKGTAGIPGVTGSAGINARAVNLTSTVQAFVYTAAGITPSPSSATITAAKMNSAGTAYYDFLLNGSSVQNTPTATYTYTPQASFASMPETIEVRLREDTNSSSVLATDQITLVGIKPGLPGVTGSNGIPGITGSAGLDAYTVILSNEAHTLPTTNAGVVTYTGCGTSIIAYKGVTELNSVTATPSAGEFKVTAAATTGIVNIGAQTITGNPAVFADHSAMITDVAVITYTIYLENGTTIVTKLQSLAKSIEGGDGIPGVTGSIGVTGPGFISTGVWTSGRVYQYSVGRRDAVLWSVAGTAPYDTYYATKQAHTADAGNLPTNTTYWESLGTEDFFVAAKIAVFEESFIQNTLNIGTNNGGGASSANIALVGGSANPYMSIGQTTQGYNQSGTFLGMDNGTSKLSLKSDTNGMSWDGDYLQVSGSINSTYATLGNWEVYADLLRKIHGRVTTEFGDIGLQESYMRLGNGENSRYGGFYMVVSSSAEATSATFNMLDSSDGGSTISYLNHILQVSNISITSNSTIQATTAKLTNLTAGYLPYHTAGGLVNSGIWTDGTKVGIGSTEDGTGARATIAGGLIVYAGSVSNAPSSACIVIDQQLSGVARIMASGASTWDAILALNPYGGNVGIGTTSPSAQLTVASAVNANPTIHLNDGDVTLPNYSAIYGSILGVGTIGLLSSTSGTKGGVQMAGFTAANCNDGNPVYFSAYHGGTAPTTAAFSFSSWKWNGSTSRVALADAEISHQFLNGTTALMTILGSGNVGISNTLTVEGDIIPYNDDMYNLGSAAYRWSSVFASSGTIDTSDARLKTGVSPLTENELNAAKQLAKEIGTFKFLKSISDKGNDARIHIGMTVQRAIKIMQDNKLDPFAYGFICYDKWDARTETKPNLSGSIVQIPAGDLYSFRTGELNLFIARGFEARLRLLEVAAGID